MKRILLLVDDFYFFSLGMSNLNLIASSINSNEFYSNVISYEQVYNKSLDYGATEEVANDLIIKLQKDEPILSMDPSSQPVQVFSTDTTYTEAFSDGSYRSVGINGSLETVQLSVGGDRDYASHY